MLVAYAVAILLTVGAVGIWYSGARARRAFVDGWRSLSNLYDLSPENFAVHVAATWRALGFHVTMTPKRGDQGLDLIAVRGRERVGIECQHKNDPTSNSAVQHTKSGVAHFGCSKGVLVALGGFTGSAKTLALATGIELVDGVAYTDMVCKASILFATRGTWGYTPQPVLVILASVLAFAAIALASITTLALMAGNVAR